ncbi:MAG: MBL fold metallo-hydrolase [bacterium]|nr:MBL fold metallo-hydrolase [bacterium]
MDEANLVFYGVRGSYPVPHKSTGKYGGNTASILIEKGDKIVILDAGTGIIRIGNYLKECKPHIKQVDLFLTHLHVDHIQGIPFFEPVFDKDFRINIYSDNHKNKKLSFQPTVYSLFAQPLSPISKKGIKAALNFIPLDTGEPRPLVIEKNFTVEYLKENDHPLAGVLIYKITVNGRRVVYATDVESPGGFDGNYLEFIRDADILIHDSHFFDDDYFSIESPKKGYGHSTVSMATANARKCGVKKLYLFHYCPDYTDEDVEKMLEQARRQFKHTCLSEESKKISLRR